MRTLNVLSKAKMSQPWRTCRLEHTVMNWKEFKVKSEDKFRNLKIENCWGFQIQPGTTWNPGLNKYEIEALEKLFGFEFPFDYKDMLLTINGFDRDQIAIDPDGKEANEFGRRMYKYPEDHETTFSLRQEIKDNINYVNEELQLSGFDTEKVVGFVPLYSHRAMAVFTDKSLSLVISIHQGDDVIVYSNSLMDYWKKEFDLDR